MILDIRVGRRAHGMSAEIAEAQSVAVRRGTRSTGGCDRAARARRVLDHDKPSGPHTRRYDHGIRLRRRIPREHHADLRGPANRDPVAILAAGDRTRVPELVPVRYERMLASPFTFLRGAAAVMAEDLKRQSTAGIPVQACGDCHLMNFGVFATPEENILFDINDFDETLAGID